MTESRAQQKRETFLRRVEAKMSALPVMSNFFFVGVSDQRNGIFFNDSVMMGTSPAAVAAANNLLLNLRDAALLAGTEGHAETIRRLQAAIDVLGILPVTDEQVEEMESQP